MIFGRKTYYRKGVQILEERFFLNNNFIRVVISYITNINNLFFNEKMTFHTLTTVQSSDKINVVNWTQTSYIKAKSNNQGALTLPFLG